MQYLLILSKCFNFFTSKYFRKLWFPDAFGGIEMELQLKVGLSPFKERLAQNELILHTNVVINQILKNVLIQYPQGIRKPQLFDNFIGHRNDLLTQNELILRTNVAGNLIKPMWCFYTPKILGSQTFFDILPWLRKKTVNLKQPKTTK